MNKMKNILIVEDDKDIHNLIKEVLTKENYKPIDAYSGTEAILLIEKEKIDLILLDPNATWVEWRRSYTES